MRFGAWCATVVVALVTLVVTSPPDTAVAGVRTTAPAVTVLEPGHRRAIITFDKNWADPSSSTLTWKVVRRAADGTRQVVERLSWRAGSGMLGRFGTKECVKGRGWLPTGGYRLRYHRDYPGTLIKGRAFRLDDHVCRDGSTRRVALFIHTEQGAGNTQCPDAPGDQACRWEYPAVNDYRSAGCIKLAPADLAELSRHFLHFYEAGVRYAKKRVVVRVVT